MQLKDADLDMFEPSQFPTGVIKLSWIMLQSVKLRLLPQDRGLPYSLICRYMTIPLLTPPLRTVGWSAKRKNLCLYCNTLFPRSSKTVAIFWPLMQFGKLFRFRMSFKKLTFCQNLAVKAFQRFVLMVLLSYLMNEINMTLFVGRWVCQQILWRSSTHLQPIKYCDIFLYLLVHENFPKLIGSMYYHSEF